MLYNCEASRRSKRSRGEGRRVGRVAEGGGLLNRCRTKSSTGGSNPPLSASKTNYLRMCSLLANKRPDLAAKSGFRLSPENLCKGRREAKPTPVYTSGERSRKEFFFSRFVFSGCHIATLVAAQHPFWGDVSPSSRCEAACTFSRSPRLPMEGSRRSARMLPVLRSSGDHQPSFPREQVLGGSHRSPLRQRRRPPPEEPTS